MTAKPMTPTQIAQGAIKLFIEHRDLHGYDEQAAAALAVSECAEAAEYSEQQYIMDMAEAQVLQREPDGQPLPW